jgi:hypothetical protein
VDYLCLVEIEEDISAASDTDVNKELSDRPRGKRVDNLLQAGLFCKRCVVWSRDILDGVSSI